MKLVKDPVHGELQIPEEDLPILDSPSVQRLRRIKQIGLGDLVYPGASHTRFEHSLGTMHIAGELGTRMGLERDELAKLRIAALLHDLGHGPFSHTSEKFSIQYGGIDHSSLTRSSIQGGPISGTLRSLGYDPGEIASVASGEDQGIGRVLHSEIGVDRMDYLMRDAHYTGVAYGVIDYDRIMSTLVFHGGEIVVREKGTQAVESLLVARFLMYPAVYLHHVARIADAMMIRALEELADGGIPVKQVMAMDDCSLMAALRTAGGLPGEMARRMLDRDLYKRAVYLPPDQLPDLGSILEMARDRGQRRQLEDDLAAAAGLESGEVLVDAQDSPSQSEADIGIMRDGRIEKLEDRSPLVKSLKQAEWNYWRFGIYCRRRDLEAVGRECERRGWRRMAG